MRRLSRLWPLAAVGLAVLALVWWMRSGEPRRQTTDAAPVPRDGGREMGLVEAPAPPAPAAEPAGLAEAPADAPDEPAADDEGETAMDDSAAAWSAVNLDQVRTALPDNLYWQNSAPTKDPAVLEQREADKARLNEQYGKILSGTASEEEIRAYYDYKARVAGDSVEFSTYLLDHYGDDIPERDVGLLELARRLHAARLEEIPRKLEEALDRKHEQDAARAAWLADERDFDDDQHED